MKTDLLKIYIKGQQVSVFNYLIVMFIFLFIKLYIYGYTGGASDFPSEMAFYFFLIIVGMMALLWQRALCLNILSGKKPLHDKDCSRVAAGIALSRLFYMLPWLYFLFQPLVSRHLFDHLPGFFFVFCAVAVYASTSASYFLLFLWDVGVQLGFGLWVAFLNKGTFETPYIVSTLLMFGLYTIISGFKITQTTRELVDKKYALEKAAHQADLANRAKSDFLSTMSHEIRTPMTGVLSMIDFMKETPLSAEQESCLDTISECSRTLLNTLNDVLDLSRMEAGKLSISRVNVDPHTVFLNSVKILQNLADEKKIGLRINIAAEVPYRIHGDPHRLQQIVVNLLSNAIKFTSEGNVSLSVVMKGKFLRVAVEDTGIGIAPEKIPKLFSQFSQADSSIARKYGGSGLGLSISQRLVDLMAGKIGVTSVPGKGSTFWFEIPSLAPVPEKKPVESAGQNIDSPPLHILLVEDNRINQMISLRLLEKKGHHVDLAMEGESAIRMVQEKDYDLILMDSNLPGRNGIETTRAIKALGGRYAAIPVITLTANAMKEHIDQCHAAGMVAHVIKPFSARDLYGAIAGALPPAKTAKHPRLRTLEQEMGQEYTQSVVASSVVEIQRLLGDLRRALAGKHYDSLRDIAHDLKSVSGAIGLERTQTLAKSLEELCAGKDYAALEKVVREIARQVESDLATIKKLYSQP